MSSALAYGSLGGLTHENERVRERLGVDTRLENVLILYGEWVSDRTTVIIVREPVGIEGAVREPG
jgi:hypothetical protein